MTRQAENQQTVERGLQYASLPTWNDADQEAAQKALRALATQASQGEDWKQLATEMGEALRKAIYNPPGWIGLDVWWKPEADALLARLDGLAAGEEGTG